MRDPEALERIDGLSPDTQPQWGVMSAGQMLSHCAEIQEVSNGKALEGTPFIVRLLGGFIRKMVVNDKPYPRSTKTHPQYLQTTGQRSTVRPPTMPFSASSAMTRGAGRVTSTWITT